jgi:hypothetical protein
MTQTWVDTKLEQSSSCPWCGAKLDCATGFNKRPSPGDLSVCIQCAQANVFKEDLTLRKMTVEEIASLSPQEAAQLAKFQFVVRSLDRRS